ncbi:MAG: hypothetical protein ACJAZ9_001556 [Neolewinella sp.]|jgi:hypothetical protein
MVLERLTKEELENMMRTIVRDELSLHFSGINTKVSNGPMVADDKKVDLITDTIFDKYDDVFKALA